MKGKKKKKGWINLHRFEDVGGRYACVGPYTKQKDAYLNRKQYDGYIATIKIEWEEEV